MQMLMIFFLSLAITAAVAADSFSPTDPNMVVASWRASEERTENYEDISKEDFRGKVIKLLESAHEPGNSYKYDLARSILKKHIAKSEDGEILFMWAKVVQHAHDFDLAIRSLEEISTKSPYFSDAQRLKARLHMTKAEYSLARKTCMRLLGRSDLVTASVCMLETAEDKNTLERNYEKLQDIVDWSDLDRESSAWVSMVLSDMAFRLRKYNEREHWLDKSFDPANLSYLIAWADAKLSAKKYNIVLEELSGVADEINFIEDAILLRLAIAEKNFHPNSHLWRRKIRERIELRELRQDDVHAADIARYYLDLRPDETKAKYWAKINWRQSKESKDRHLLERASQLSTGDMLGEIK